MPATSKVSTVIKIQTDNGAVYLETEDILHVVLFLKEEGKNYGIDVKELLTNL